MPRHRTGSVTYNKRRKSWVARLDWIDADTGKKMCRKKQVVSKTDARVLIKQWINDLAKHGAKIFEGERLKFEHVAARYEGEYLHAPVYRGEVRLSGKRSYKTDRRRLKTLVGYFGKLPIRRVTREIVTKFKLHRLDSPNQRDKGRKLSIAAVNRELALLRSVMNYALGEGWIANNPFKRKDALISTAQETKRDRILTPEEESRLLAACTGQRTHLRPILVCALDTAMRRGEILGLRWKDIDLMAGRIVVRATITKTETPRVVPVSARLRRELEKLRAQAPPDPEGSVFGVGDFKKAFYAACRDARVAGFRFHDTRHTAITRMIQRGGLHAIEVMTISGHTDARTFKRYVNNDERTLQRAVAAMDQSHAMGIEPARPELIN